MLEKATRNLLPIFLIAITVLVILKLTTLLVPILIAYLVSLPLCKLAQAISRGTRLPNGASSAIVVLLALVLVVGLLGFGVYRLIGLLSGFQNYLGDITERVKEITSQLPSEGVFSFMPRVYDLIMENLSQITDFATNFLVGRIKEVPRVLVSLLFFVLSLFFFTKDAALVARKRDELLTRLTGRSPAVRKAVVSTLFQYFRAQFILMSITFGISFVLLMIYRIPFFPLVALGIALIDVLPLLGPAVVYTPWIGFTLLSQNYVLAALLFVAYLVTTLTRQVLEPKIVSSSMGIHPLLTISTMCVCYGFLGTSGLLVGIFLVILALIAIRVIDVVNKETALPATDPTAAEAGEPQKPK